MTVKVVYVGVPDTYEFDQIIEDVEIGPLAKGSSRFILQAPAPDAQKIPPRNMLGVTVLLVGFYFNDKEFFRTG